jgi:hypothetical protein
MLCMMFLPMTIHADEIHGHFWLGYLAEDNDYSADLQISYTFWIVTLQGGVEVLMEKSPESTLFFCPYRDTYYFDLILRPLKYLSFAFSHQCTHPVYSYDKLFYDKFEGGNRTILKAGIEW